MRKKKMLVIEAAALILGTLFVSSVSAATLNVSNSSLEKSDDLGVSRILFTHFSDCTISGTYTTNSSNDEFSYIVESDTKSIFVTGIALVYCSGDIPVPCFRSVRTDSIKTNYFQGKCSNGSIAGLGHYVEIGDYEHIIKDKPKTLNIFNFFERKLVFDSPLYDIEYFYSCSITGSYTNEIVNDGTSVRIKSDTKSIKVSGAAQVYGANPGIPNIAFRSVKTDEVSTQDFHGICSNGKVIGRGCLYVRIGDYEHIIKSEPKTLKILNLFERVFRNILYSCKS